MSWLSRLFGGDRPHEPRSLQHDAGWPEEKSDAWRRHIEVREAAQAASDNEPRNFDRTSDEAAPTAQRTNRTNDSITVDEPMRVDVTGGTPAERSALSASATSASVTAPIPVPRPRPVRKSKPANRGRKQKKRK